MIFATRHVHGEHPNDSTVLQKYGTLAVSLYCHSRLVLLSGESAVIAYPLLNPYAGSTGP